MSAKQSNGLAGVLAKIEAYPVEFRQTALQLHEIVMKSGEALVPRLWYGMPGYAKSENGPVLVYFRKDKYITFGRTESSNIVMDDKTKSAEVAWYFTEINEESANKISIIVQSAIK